MKSTIFLFLVLSATVLSAQTAPVTTSTSGPGRAPTAGVQPLGTAPAADCSKEVTIYIDLSGTMTAKDPTQTNENRIPLNFIASTLLQFVSNEDFIRPGDKVSVKYFGTIVQTEAAETQEVRALLTNLANMGTWRATLSAVNAADFQRFTDFDKVFHDVADHVVNSTSARQIVFIASDFSQDQFNQPGVNNVAPRVEAFRKALETIRPFLSTSTTPGMAGKVQLVGIYAPDPPDRFDRSVADQVKGDVRAAGMRLYQYNEDASEAARTLRNYFVGPVTAKPAEPVGVSIGGDGRVGVLAVNPNCNPVEVVGLSFHSEALGTSRTIQIPPKTITNGSTELRVEIEGVSSLWNQEVTVTPVLKDGTAARTSPSPTFWLGDWVRISQPVPFLYPWGFFDHGTTLLAATVRRSVRSNGAITIGGIEPGGRGRSFTIPQGTGEETMAFAFDLNQAQLAHLSGPNIIAPIDGNNLRIISDQQTTAVSQQIPVAASVMGTAGTRLAMAMLLSFFLIGALAVRILVTTFGRSDDVGVGQQGLTALTRLAPLAIPGLATALLWPGFVPIAVSSLGAIVLVRSLLTAFTFFMIFRFGLVSWGWKGITERYFLQNEIAVGRRKRWNIFIWCLAIAITVGLLWSFFWPASGSPPSSATVLRGDLR